MCKARVSPIFYLLSILTLICTNATGAVSYLLLQGDFDSSSPGLESSRWTVTYDPATVITGEDLLKAVFGAPKLIVGTTDKYETDPSSWSSDGTTWKLNYTKDPSFGYFITSITRNGVTKTNDFGNNTGWNYFVAGGGGFSGSDYSGADYASGVWTYSTDGLGTRTLSNGSYDAWSLGSTGTYDNDFNQLTPPDSVSGFNPTTSSFTGSTVNQVTTAAPEPTRTLLLASGMAAIALRRRKSAAC